MPEDFLNGKLYLKLFPLQELSAELTAKALRLWQVHGLPSRDQNGPIQVVSIGFGMGARDVAVLMGLATAMAKTPSGKKGVPSIHVLAIDPAATKPGIADNRSFLTKADFTKVKQPSSSAEIWVKKALKDQSEIRIEIVGTTAEAWIAAQPSGQSFKWDVVLACAVLHLLVDWKSTLDFFLRGLKPDGVFAFAEASGTVGAFEGEFRDGVKDSAPRWVKLWHAVSQVRERLLLPATRVVAPGNMSFLAAVLEGLDYRKLTLSETESCIEAAVRKETTVADIQELIDTVKGGSDAQTLGALRIRDRDRAALFVMDVKKAMMSHGFHPDEVLAFETGTRIHVYRKPASQCGIESRTAFASGVAGCSSSRSQFEALERKASVKEALRQVGRLGGSRGHDTAPVRSEQAIAALLYDMREALALSRDTLMVIARRSGSGSRYTEAFQLPPTSLIGSASSESAGKYIASMSVYTAAVDMDKHLSKLLAGMDDIGDLTVRVDICPDSEVSRNRLPMDLHVSYATNGAPCFVRLAVSEELMRQSKAETRGNTLFDEAASAQYAEAYDGCLKDGCIARFYIRPDIDRLRQVLKIMGESEQSAIEQSIETNVAGNALEKHLKEEVVANFSSLSDESRSALVKILVSSLRLSWIEWRYNEDDLPPWRSCYYFVRKNAHGAESQLGVGLLLLLPAGDRQAWDTLHNCAVPAGPAQVPSLIAAVEPFLAAIQEIRVPEIAAGKAFQDVRQVLGHELGKIYQGADCALRVACSRKDTRCRFTKQTTLAALEYGMLWSDASPMLGESIMPVNASRQGVPWGPYIENVAVRSWRLFLGTGVVFQHSENFLDNVDAVSRMNTLWEANISSLLRVDGDCHFLWPLKDGCDLEAYGDALYRWFMVGLCNAWKHAASNGDKGWYRQDSIARLEKAEAILTASLPVLTMSASTATVEEERRTVFDISNGFKGTEHDPPSFSRGTGLALRFSADELENVLKVEPGSSDLEFGVNASERVWHTGITLRANLIECAKAPLST